MSARQYELMVILDAELEERTVGPSLDRFLNVVRQGGGEVGKVDIWGRRRLSYDIKKSPRASTPSSSSPPSPPSRRSSTVS